MCLNLSFFRVFLISGHSGGWIKPQSRSMVNTVNYFFKCSFYANFTSIHLINSHRACHFSKRTLLLFGRNMLTSLQIRKWREIQIIRCWWARNARNELEIIWKGHLSCAVGGARAWLSFYLGAALSRADLANWFDQLRTGWKRILFVSRCCTYLRNNFWRHARFLSYPYSFLALLMSYKVNCTAPDLHVAISDSL